MRLYQQSILAVLLVTLLVASTGCTENPGDRLIGKWQGSGRFDSVGPGVEAQFVGAAMARIHLTMDFRGDGTMTSRKTIGDLPDDKPLAGPWRVVESGQDRLVIELTGELDGQTVSKRAEIEFLGDDEITLVDPDEPMLTEFILKRVP